MSGNVMKTTTEPILVDEEDERFTAFPVRELSMFKMYKQAEASFWTVEEVNVVDDKPDWNRLTDGERHFVKNVLAFFAASDGIVNENLALNFYSEVKVTEARLFYGMQIAIENIHSLMYSTLIDTYISDPEEKRHLFRANLEVPCVKRKADWALRWCDRARSSFAERLVAFAVVEGIFFSGSFCAIFWLKKRGLMPGLCTSNEFISRDEATHCLFACLLYSRLQHPLPEERVYEIVREAVDIECEFVRDSLPVSLIGMNANLMQEYIRFVADYWLQRLGYAPLYGACNPFDWMTMISVPGKTNFFEKRVTEYARANIAASATTHTKIELDEDF